MENPSQMKKLPSILRRATSGTTVTKDDGQQQNIIEHNIMTKEKVNFVPFMGATLPMSTMFIIKTEDSLSSTNSSVPSSCVVCHRRCSADLVIQNKISLKTEADLQFLLGSILGFASESLKEYKEQFGALQSWVPLCSQCLDVIKEGRQIQEQISQLEKHLKARKDLISEKVMDIYYCQGENCSENLEKVRTLVDSFLKAQGQRVKEDFDTKEEPDIDEAEIETMKHSENEDEDYMDLDNLSSGEEEMEKDKEGNDNDPLQDYYDEDEEEVKEDDAVVEVKVKPPKNKNLTSTGYYLRREFGFRYSCPSCPLVKNYSVNRYVQHLAIHQRRPYKCSECYEFLPPDEDGREQHWKDKHPDKEPSAGEVKFIEIKFDPGKIYKCEGTGCWSQLGFSTPQERDKHESKCRNFELKKEKCEAQWKREIRTCSTCEPPQSFRNREEFRFHRAILHPELDSLCCPNCDKSFAEKTADSGIICRNDFKMKEHLKTEHEGREKADARIDYDECELCGMVFGGGGFGKFEAKSAHVRKAHGLPESEAYSCKICRKTFKKGYLVRQHVLNIHFPPNVTPVQQLVCDLCGENVQGSKYLRHHKYTKHGIVPSGAKVHSCSHSGCEYKSVIKFMVTLHFKTSHEQVRERKKPPPYPVPSNSIEKYQCEVCGNCLTTQGNLNLHMKTIHERNRPEKPPISKEFDPSRPFRCKICGNGFINKARLKRHEQIHQNKDSKPFKCDTCSREFAVKDNLSSHKLYHCLSGGWRKRNPRVNRKSTLKRVIAAAAATSIGNLGGVNPRSESK